LRALRANHDFCTDKKRIRTEIMVMDKSNDALGLFYTRSLISRGYAFHPREINDPRGRAAVRASSVAGGRATRMD